MKTYLAIGAHIGDMDLTAGPLLTTAAQAGCRTVLLALTPGERGHPRMAPRDYQAQKLEEGHAFAARIGAELRVLDYSDGFLPSSQAAASQVANIVRELRPDVLIAHWKNSVHTDHENASTLAEQARSYAALPMEHELPRHHVEQFIYTENWEDEEGFEPAMYVPIPDEAFDLWLDAVYGHSFARGEPTGFRYIDYYTALMTMRGCLAGVPRACAFALPAPTSPELVDLP